MEYRARIESVAIVLNDQAQLRSIARELNPRVMRIRVAHDVGDRFLRDSKHGSLDRGRQTSKIGGGFELNLDTRRLQIVFGVSTHRRRQSQIVEQSRTQVEDHLVHVLQRLFAKRTRAANLGADLTPLRRHQLFTHFDVEQHPRQ